MSHVIYVPNRPHIGYSRPCDCPPRPEALLRSECPAFPEWAAVQHDAKRQRAAAAAAGTLPAPFNAEPRARLLELDRQGSQQARDMNRTAELTVHYLLGEKAEQPWTPPPLNNGQTACRSDQWNPARSAAPSAATAD